MIANQERLWSQESRSQNVDNLSLCSVTYWRVDIRMSNVQSKVSNSLHVLVKIDVPLASYWMMQSRPVQ